MVTSDFSERLNLPLVMAPMFQISNPAMVIAACRSRIIGSFPTANCRTPAELDSWLDLIGGELGPEHAPFAANLIIKSPRLEADLDCLVRHRVELVIASVAVRSFYDGRIMLAGGVSDGTALWAAQALGADFGYMGTPFIATDESPAADKYKAMLIASEFDDVVLTRAFSGLETNQLLPSIIAAGIDPAILNERANFEETRKVFGGGTAEGHPRRWRDLWSAGHTVSGVQAVTRISDLVARLKAEYEGARERSLARRP